MTRHSLKRAYLDWSERFAVGVPSLDKDHRDLVDLINMACAAWADRKQDDLQQVLQKLLALAAQHFEREEEILRGVPGYLALKTHAGEHRNRLAQLRQILDSLGHDGTEAAVASLPDALVDWFLKQSIGHDAAIKGYFDNGGLRHAAG